MLDELVKKIVDWSNVEELVNVYIKKYEELDNESKNKIYNEKNITFVIGDAIHDIFNNEKEGIDFSRIPELLSAYKMNKNKFWLEVFNKYNKDKNNYSINNLKDIISHFYVALCVCYEY